MNIRQELGILGGILFLAVSLGYGIVKGFVAYENYQTAQQNAYAISILEQVRVKTDERELCDGGTNGLLMFCSPWGIDASDSAAINDRVDEIEKQYTQ